MGRIRLPVLIGEKKIKVEVKVVEAYIPLLVGSNSLKASKAKLDFDNFIRFLTKRLRCTKSALDMFALIRKQLYVCWQCGREGTMYGDCASCHKRT